MWELLRTVVRSAVSALRLRRDLAVENLALRHQLVVLKRQSKKPRFEDRDRLFWISMKRIWSGWTGALHLVQPATVVKWHRAGSVRCVDRSTTSRSLSLRHRASLLAPRQRQKIQGRVRSMHRFFANRGSENRTKIALAESILREADRVYTPRMLGSGRRAE